VTKGLSTDCKFYVNSHVNSDRKTNQSYMDGAAIPITQQYNDEKQHQ